jgi:hypothetical protein
VSWSKSSFHLQKSFFIFRKDFLSSLDSILKDISWFDFHVLCFDWSLGEFREQTFVYLDLTTLMVEWNYLINSWVSSRPGMVQRNRYRKLMLHLVRLRTFSLPFFKFLNVNVSFFRRGVSNSSSVVTMFTSSS